MVIDVNTFGAIYLAEKLNIPFILNRYEKMQILVVTAAYSLTSISYSFLLQPQPAHHFCHS
jgi:hypothetical protein